MGVTGNNTFKTRDVRRTLVVTGDDVHLDPYTLHEGDDVKESARFFFVFARRPGDADPFSATFPLPFRPC